MIPLNGLSRSKEYRNLAGCLLYFKSKKKAIGSARFTGSLHVYPDAIQLPRLGLLRLKEHHYLPMNAKSAAPRSAKRLADGTSPFVCLSNRQSQHKRQVKSLA